MLVEWGLTQAMQSSISADKLTIQLKSPAERTYKCITSKDYLLIHTYKNERHKTKLLKRKMSAHL